MDARRFDTLTRHLGSPITRRTVQATLALAGALATLARLGLDSDAKKKPKKKKPTCAKPNTKCGAKGCCKPTQVCANGKCATACQFTKTTTTWTLKGDCTTTKTITIPDGVTLDGNGKTIKLAGLFPEGSIGGVATSSVRNLTIDGLTLSAPCSAAGVSGIRFVGTEGEITGVTLMNLTCTSGVYVVGGSLAINNSTFDNLFIGVNVDGGGSLTVDSNTISSVTVGLIARGGSLDAKNNTIVGKEQGRAFAGVYYFDLGRGEVSGNTISRFADSDAGEVSCGIRVDADAGAVTIGANTFPDPPGNEQNVCDNRE